MSVDPDLKLWYDFANDRSLVGRIGPTLGITRSGPGSYFDGNGVLQSAASGVARFDHEPVTGERIGILTEEARTNICLKSQDFTFGSEWASAGFAAVNQNVTTSPDGTLNADRFIDDNGGGASSAMRFDQNVTLVVSTVYQLSIFLKADGLGWCALGMGNNTTANVHSYFNFSNGTKGTLGAGATSAEIEDVGNGWYRCSIIFTSHSSDTTGTIQLWMADGDGDTTVDRDGTSSYFVWQCDLQAGDFVASPIPTTTSSVTRNFDEISVGGLGSIINDNLGTMYAEWKTKSPSAVSRIPFEVNDGDASDRHSFFISGSHDISFWNPVSSTPQANVIALSGIPNNGPGTWYREAGCWALNDFHHAANGTLAPIPDTLGTLGVSQNQINIGSGTGSAGPLNGHIKEIRYYDVRKENQFLKDLSNGLISHRLDESMASVRGGMSGFIQG